MALKIAIIHHQLRRSGGMERYIFDLLSGFAAANDKVTTIVYQRDPSIQLPDSVAVQQHHLNWMPRRWRKYYFARRLAKHHDLNAYDLTLSTMRTFHQDVLICGGTHRGCLAIQHKKRRFRDYIEIRAEQKAIINSKVIVAHSQLIADELQQYYQVDANKIHTILPPIDTTVFHYGVRAQRELHRQQYNIDSRKMTLLFPSTGHVRKGIEPLLDAMKQLPADRIELLIAGDEISSAKNLPNVRCLGFVDDMASLYAAVDCTILPSWYEPFGLVVPESLACGTPVIISNKVGAKTLVNENTGIILDDINSTTIACALLSLEEKKIVVPENVVDDFNLTIAAHIRCLKALAD